ncbi:hypothetical protein F4780DRAFT_226686 [Xylariomycetidae sp. FL0641]|nr:hypothetical protein F4780DRAFT_226686 [Xylariomycetidae sp. FL0641]
MEPQGGVPPKAGARRVFSMANSPIWGHDLAKAPGESDRAPGPVIFGSGRSLFSNPSKPAKPLKPVKPAKTAEPVNPVKPVMPVKPVPRPKPSQPYTSKQPATQPPSNLGKLGLTEGRWKKLEGSRKTTPRFLFRGFHSMSGGDPRLNKPEAITPRAFLSGMQPTNIYDHLDLRRNINWHISGFCINTYFSSWAASLDVALRFTQRGSGSYVAIADTNLLPANVQIYFTPHLERAGLSYLSYDEEYLVYGVVTGQALHCVLYSDLEAAGLGSVPLPRYTELSEYETFTAQCKSIAYCFQSPAWKQPDAVVAVTAMLIGRAAWSTMEQDHLALTDRVMSRILGDKIGKVTLPPNGSAQIGLVNRNMYVKGYPDLEVMVDILQRFEETVNIFQGLQDIIRPRGYKRKIGNTSIEGR